MIRIKRDIYITEGFGIVLVKIKDVIVPFDELLELELLNALIFLSQRFLQLLLQL